MIAVIKKPSGYEIAYVIPKKYSLDIRDSLSATWKDIIMSIARSSEGILSGDFFYRELEGRKKTLSNPNWKAKIRQTLQQLAQAGLLKHVGIGQDKKTTGCKATSISYLKPQKHPVLLYTEQKGAEKKRCDTYITLRT